ncbi:neuronal acetylcholine receptor subunit alpha-6-like [Argopecten irradians]|uniref:neuronal acetylcholine receptor subunit alpha-6-like n=1 Tax=Argopecten irradians TaxID=31199 RepID=UPI003711B2FE
MTHPHLQWITLWLSLSGMCCSNRGRAAEVNAVKQLWDDLFVNKSYNKFIRPVQDHRATVVLETDMNLVAIVDVNVVEEKLTTTAFLELKWTDENLVWDETLYDNVTELLLPQTEIWTPDIALDNGFGKMKALGDDFVLINIKSDGSIFWEPYEVFETKCAMDVEYFPFDSQTCNISVGVWTSDIDQIFVRTGAVEFDLEYYQESSEWNLTGWVANTYTTESKRSMIRYSLHLKRRPQYYVYNVVAPILMLSILAIFTFAIPTESGEKLGFCMTVYLAFAVFLTIVSASLPVSSVLSLLGKYLIFLLIVGTLIVVICTLELRIHFRDSSHEIPAFIQALVQLSLFLQWRRLKCRSCRRQKVHDVQEKSEIIDGIDVASGENPVQISWTDVSSTIDFYCFWIFLVVVVSGTFILFRSGL